jgi:hypothetical protein
MLIVMIGDASAAVAALAMHALGGMEVVVALLLSREPG